MGFDLAAFTRAISGGLTQKKENEHRIEQDRLRAEGQALVDTMRRTSIQATREAGRRQRAKDVEVAAQKAKDLEEDNQRRLDQQARAKQLREQLSRESREVLGDVGGLSLADQITAYGDAVKRQREAARDTREHGQALELRGTPTGKARTPTPLSRDARVRRIVTRYLQLVRDGEKPREVDLADPNLEALQKSGEVVFQGGMYVRTPTPPAQIQRQAMLQAFEERRHEFSDEEQVELTGILDGIVQSGEGDEQGPSGEGPSNEEIKQMIIDLNAQGLSHEEIQATLAQRGIKVSL